MGPSCLDFTGSERDGPYARGPTPPPAEHMAPARAMDGGLGRRTHAAPTPNPTLAAVLCRAASRNRTNPPRLSPRRANAARVAAAQRNPSDCLGRALPSYHVLAVTVRYIVVLRTEKIIVRFCKLCAASAARRRTRANGSARRRRGDHHRSRRQRRDATRREW